MTLPLPAAAVRPVGLSWLRKVAALALLLTAGTLAEAQLAYFSGATSTVGSGFSFPSQIAVDASGDVFVADAGNHAVKEIVAVYGVVSSTSQVMTVGSGFSSPCGVAVDSMGDVFVGDVTGNAVKEIVAVGGVVSSTSQVNTVGSGFSHPCGVAVDSKGDVFVADSSNAAVKEIVAVNALVSPSSQVNTVGSGFSEPYGVAVDASGDVFVGDNNTGMVQEIVAVAGVVSSTSQVKTLSSGQFAEPVAVAVDASGDVFVADSYNNTVTEIVAVAGVVSSTSQVKTLGSGFSFPGGVAVGASGDVLIADSFHNAVKEIQLQSVNFGGVAVASSTTQTLTFTFTSGGTIAAPKVLTQGATGLDFTDTGSGSCNEYAILASTLNAGNTCTVVVQFKPTAPGQRMGAVELFASGSSTPIATAYVYGTGTGPLVTFPSNATPVILGASFHVPEGVAVDASGNVYVADTDNHIVKEMTPNCTDVDCVTTHGGGFGAIQGVAIDGAGNIYVADTASSEVKEMSASCHSYSCVNLLGGYSTFSYPGGVAVDGAGNVYVADTHNNAVKEFPAGCTSATCLITLGGGFSAPGGVAVDGAGNIYIADTGNTAIKKMPAGCASSACVTTVAGGFSKPLGVAVDGGGNLYVADGNAGNIDEIPYGCTSGTCGIILASHFGYPTGVAVDGSGNVYLADADGNGVQELPFATPPSITFATSTQDGATDTTDGTQTVKVANAGNAPLSFEPLSSGSNPSVSAGFTLANGGTACPVLSSTSSAQTLAAGASCTLGIEFTPVAPDNGTVSGSVVLTDTSLNANSSPYTTQSIAVQGTAIGGDTTTTTLASTSSSVGSGASVSLTATVKDTTNTGTVPTGSVSFTDTYNNVTTTLSSSPATLNGGSARVLAILNGDGVHTLTANYAGVTGSFLSSSNTTMVTVGTAIRLSLSAPAKVYVGQSFTVTVTALDSNSQTATLYGGTVNLLTDDPAAVLPATVTLTAGVGTFTATLNTVGAETIEADSVNFSLQGVTLISVAPPPTFTVTVATDTTSGVASNCVANALNNPNCSLRDAIAAVTALNLPTVTPTIQFSPLLTSGGPVTITEGSAGTLTLGTNMNIVGPGQTLLAIDGANANLVLSVQYGSHLPTVSISGVTIQHGNGSVDFPSGINNSGALTLTNSSIVSNTNAGAGAVYNTGSLTLTNCKVANNASSSYGGGIGGGVTSPAGTLTISGSSITGNTGAGGSSYGGGAGVLAQSATVSISNSTISGNTESNSGGYGGGLDAYQSTVTLTNVTITGNSATHGGGVYQSGGTLTLIQSTVSGNTATNDGGMDLAAGSAVLKNSVVAGNTATNAYPNLNTTPTDGGGNYFDAVSTTSPLNPKLAVLGNYGGSTQTMPGLPGSPLLCAGTVANAASLTTDQRGNPRIATYGSNQCVDAGAVQTAYSVAFVQQPNNTETGLALSPAPAILLQDNGAASGIPGASIAITLANGTLNGTATATTDSTGTASFSGLSIPTVETGDTLTASVAAGTNTITATSNPFNVITVTATPAIASKVLTQNQTSAPFTPVTGSGGTAPLSYSIAPALPAGLTLASTTGAISGSPTATSNATTYTVTVTDADSVSGTATFSLTVNSAVAATQAIASTVLTQNYAAAFTPVTGTGGTGALSYSVSPALPTGLSLASATGLIAGTATVASAATTYTVTVADTNNATATATFSLTVNTAVTATQAVPSTTVVLNQPATAFTPVTGAGGTGTLSFSISPALPAGLSLASTTGVIAGTPTATSSATVYTVTATDSNGATATATFSLTVILSVPPTVASVSAVTTTYGATTGVTVTATESGNQGLATGGIVTFGVSGSATGSFSPATCTLSSAGTCTTTFLPTGTLAAGTYTGGITASFALVNSYSAASGTSTLTVNPAAQTITFAPASPVTYGVAPITLAATGGSSGNAIAYTLGTGSPASLNGSVLTITGAGTVTLTANQAGNANYTAAAGVTATIVVNKATPTAALVSSVNPVLVQNAVTLTATVTGVSIPTGAVSFYDNTAGSAIGSANLVSGVATLPTSTLAVGTHSITAIYSGDANFVSATSSPVSEQVQDFTLSITSSGGTVTTQTAVPGGTATYLLTISPMGTTTFPAPVALSVSGLPTGASYTLTPPSIAAGAGATSVTLTITLPNQAARLDRPGSVWKGLAPVTLAMLLLPFARRWRRSALQLRRLGYLALLLVAAAGAMAGLTGCGSGNGIFGQAPQTYNVVVTGTSGALSHTTSVTLTVE